MTATTIVEKHVNVDIRWMICRDFPQVVAIEAESFENPWCEADFIYWLRMRNVIGMVAEHGKLIVGFFLYELHKFRLQILDFAVREDWRQKGVGREMVNRLKSKLSPYRRSRITLEIRETNLDAQVFFRAMGFRCVATHRDFYDDAPDDAYSFVYRHCPKSDQ